MVPTLVPPLVPPGGADVGADVSAAVSAAPPPPPPPPNFMFSIYMLLLRMAAGAEREMLPGAQRWSDEGEGEGEGTGDDVAPPSPVPAPVPPPPASLVVSRASIAKVVAEFADDTSAQTSLLRFITARTATSNVPRLFDWLQVNEVRGCGGAGCGDGWGAATGGVRQIGRAHV